MSEKQTIEAGNSLPPPLGSAGWTDLIPCPFCGGGAQHASGMGEHWVLCTGCGAAGRMRGTRQHAVDAWNTRTAWLPDGRDN